MDATERYDALKQIKDEVLTLKASPLFKYRNENKYYPVVGEGDHFAKIMFVGEAPGQTEAKTARPFCGTAGKVLDRLIESAGLKREQVYITNLVKDRPPGNRDPKPEEILLYSKFLDRQIEIIQPKVIATLGRFSMAYLMDKFGVSEKDEPISKLHGKAFKVKAEYGPLKLVILYHPAVAVYNPNLFGVLEKDFKKALAG
ncbi:MAG: uracil-DNA glycosylase [Candidatus Vogelbacteria bacterium]|nr:uracil-DNA glycosylase [Candidatus Vogelbacteria bacterium]